MKYVFRNPLKLSLAVLIDIIGFCLSLPFKILKKSAPCTPKNIIVIRLDHIGDFVCSTPIFRNLRTAFAKARITALVNPACQELAKANPYIDEVLILDAPWLRKGKVLDCFVARLRRAPRNDTEIGFTAGTRNDTEMGFVAGLAMTRRRKFDLGIEARGDFFSILIMFLAGVGYKVGHGITGGGFLLDKEAPFDKNAHAVDKNLTLLESISIGIIDRKPEVFFKDIDKVAVEALLEGMGLKGKKQIVLHPFAGTKAKAWGGERFEELIKALKENGFDILLIGSQYDEFVAEIKHLPLFSTHPACGGARSNSILRIEQQTHDLRGKLSLTQLAYLIKKTGLFVGLDSGPANMAMSLGVPSVIICSGTNLPEIWLPPNPKGMLIFKDAPCKPCELTICKKKTHLCMDSITVREVIDAIKEIASAPSVPRNDTGIKAQRNDTGIKAQRNDTGIKAQRNDTGIK